MEPLAEPDIQQCRYDQWPHQSRNRHQTEEIEDDGRQVDGRQQDARRSDPPPARQPRPTLRPHKESVHPIPLPPTPHHPRLGHQTVTEIVGAGHLPYRLLPHRDRLGVGAFEQPALQCRPPGGRAAHADQVQKRRAAVEVEVVGVVVVLPGRGNGRIGQLGPATADARDAFPVEVGHQLGAEEAPLRDVVPRDQEREGHRCARDECPGGRAPSRGEEDPHTSDGGREEGEPEAAVQSHCA